MKGKLRIQLLTKEGIPVSDRLIDQTTEFYQGPKEPHDGQMKIEFHLTCQDDTNKAIDYLKKLTGLLPIETKTTATRGPKTKTTIIDDADDKSRENFIIETVNSSKNQDEFINTLRKLDYRFVNSDMLKTMIPEAYKIKEVHLGKYDWLIQRTREAKDPRNDRFDLTIIMGISIMDKRNPKIVVYLFGEFWKSFKLEVPKKNPITQRNTNLIKYPHYMTYDEREKWGIEHRMMKLNPEKKATKFYKRWVKDVTVPDELKLDPPYEKR